MNGKNDIKSLIASVRTALSLLVVLTILLGVVYPLVVTVIAKIFFADASSGSLISRDGKIIGSHLLAQNFTDPKYFWARPSQNNYNAMDSAGTNLSPANPKLLEAVSARTQTLQKADPDNKDKIPVDLVTASSSGLDPHISVAAAKYQSSRIANARKIKLEEVQVLIDGNTNWQSQFFGEPYVNVLELNLALDELKNEEKN